MNNETKNDKATVIKVIAVLFIVSVILLMLTVPVGAILILAKLCGAGLSWAAACVPVFIAIGISPITAITKFIIDVATRDS
jgi:hypothetical protein